MAGPPSALSTGPAPRAGRGQLAALLEPEEEPDDDPDVAPEELDEPDEPDESDELEESDEVDAPDSEEPDFAGPESLEPPDRLSVR